jgi:hypothetical protein
LGQGLAKSDYTESNLFESPATLPQASDPLTAPVGIIPGLFSTGVIYSLYRVILTKAALRRALFRLPGNEDTYLYSMTFRI